VLWSKRIVRYIDLNDSINKLIFPLADPEKGEAFLSSLFGEIENGTVNVWIFDSLKAIQTLRYPLTISEVEKLAAINVHRITGYLLLEDWFFDGERSVMDVTPQAIIPVFSDTKRKDTLLPLFAVYYPDAMNILKKNDCDTAFRKRIFTSEILAETNLYDPCNEQLYRFAGLQSDCRMLLAKVQTTEQLIYTF
jgi:hypothetical protein